MKSFNDKLGATKVIRNIIIMVIILALLLGAVTDAFGMFRDSNKQFNFDDCDGDGQNNFLETQLGSCACLSESINNAGQKTDYNTKVYLFKEGIFDEGSNLKGKLFKQDKDGKNIPFLTQNDLDQIENYIKYAGNNPQMKLRFSDITKDYLISDAPGSGNPGYNFEDFCYVSNKGVQSTCTFSDFKQDFLVKVGTYEYEKRCMITNDRCAELVKQAEKSKTKCNLIVDQELDKYRFSKTKTTKK